MNRIRKINNEYQVLNYPCRNFDPSNELLSGGWTDDRLRGFSVVTFNTMNEAQMEATNNGADINWEKIYEDHKIYFNDLKQNVVDVLIKYNFIVDFNAKLLNGRQIKDALFDRVINNVDFTLANNFNDVITFNIVNPWSKNCEEIVKLLKSTKKLKIYREKKLKNVTHLIGITPSHTTYKIIIWTTLMYQCSTWLNMHPLYKNNKAMVNDMYTKAITSQIQLDKSLIIR